jgi:cytochrome c5
MSDPQNPPEDHDGPHEGPIRTPRQLVLAVLYAFVVPVIVIVMLVEFVTSTHRPAAGTQALTPAAVAERLQPVGMVQVKDASDLSTLKTGAQVFAAQCTTCHTAGLVGSPKLGDTAAWAPRIKTGYEALLHSALAGKGNMGAQGGGDYADLEIGRAVVYMANKAGAQFAEPALPAASASAAPVAAATSPAPAAPAAMPPTAAAVPSLPAPAAAPVAAAAVVAAVTTAVATAPAIKTEAPGAVPVLYAQVCQVCHAAGVAGAPKLGDKAAWAPRIAEAKTVDGLTASAIKGKGAMPPRGGSGATDAEIKAVVSYMVSSVK